MCGIVVLVGARNTTAAVTSAVAALHHRGPDATGTWIDHAAGVGLGHTRLSIIDVSDAGRQPMASADERFVMVFNGEVYNYLELRAELADYPFRSHTDSEVVLAAWVRWGEACLDRLIGMFAFVIWDRIEQRLVAVRDRFGVKPLYIAQLPGGGIALASEIKALHAAGVPREHDPIGWATYLAHGLTDSSRRTFWHGIEAVPAGHLLVWRADQPSQLHRWYDLAARVGADYDTRDLPTTKEAYRALLTESVRLRFRSDVPVGINLSGGLDSSTLLGLVHAVRGPNSDVMAFTFTTGDANYDELPWVEGMLEHTRHTLVTCTLTPEDTPALAERITRAEDEPFGGLPTLAYANLFEQARRRGVIVLLDGQGMDEQWAGYDYYRSTSTAIVQGARDPIVQTDCIARDFAALAETFEPASPFPDRLRNLQLRDTLYTKLARALRFNDRASMAASVELREPFLDHRLFELALRQPADRKIRGDVGKWMLREITHELVPQRLRLAPKRPIQTPQREWLRGPLVEWADSLVEHAFAVKPEWFDVPAARRAWHAYRSGRGDNSFWVWQWLSLGLQVAS